MSKVMDEVLRTSLLIFSCFTFLYIEGKGQAGSVPPCEVHVMVPRGQAWETAPGQNVTLTCPVRNCGRDLTVTWCKLDMSCDKIEGSPNVEIMQRYDGAKDELISSLTFMRISAHQDGWYRCASHGNSSYELGRSIRISVSDNHTGIAVKQSVKRAGNEPSPKGGENMPFFFICFGMVMFIATVTALTYLSFYCWERIPTSNSKMTQEMPSRTQPDLPMSSSPSLPLPQAQIHSACTPGASPAPPNTVRPAVANAAAEGQASDFGTYSVISLKKPTMHAGGRPVATHKSSEYSAICVSLAKLEP